MFPSQQVETHMRIPPVEDKDTDITVDGFDNLISLRNYAFIGSVDTTFSSYGSQSNMQQADRSSLVAEPLSEPDPVVFSVRQTPFVGSVLDTMIQCESPTTSENDMTEAHYMESQTPVEKSRSSSSLSRDNRFTSVQTLYQLREFLLTSLMNSSSSTQERTSSMNSSMRLPRESVAVLLDAVRASTLHDNEKCRFMFDLFDADMKGVISRDDVTAFVEGTLLSSNLHSNGDFQVYALVEEMFAHSSVSSQMRYSEFEKAFGQAVPRPTSIPTAHDTIDSTSQLSQYKPSFHYRHANVAKKKENFWRRVVVKHYLKYDTEIHWLVFYFAVLIAAFFIKAARVDWDPAAGHAPQIAKGFAQVIMVNTCFLLLPMCRNFMTFLRQLRPIALRVPIDKHIEFHKICGVVMLLASLGHVIAWIILIVRLRTVSTDIWHQSRFVRLAFVREDTFFELFARIPMWTGCLMVVIAMIAAPMTHPKIRRGDFNVFWLTHLLFVPFLVLMLVHGVAMCVQPPQAALWVLPPLLLYMIEKRYRVTAVFGGHVTIARVDFTPDTVAIYMTKPPKFRFHPGMYIYLNAPVISRFEWHPFTISSAPEDECLSIHVHVVGDWTKALYRTLKTIEDARHNAPTYLSPYPPVFIDGPVGTPSQDYFRYKSVVFVGAGFGATPFASILRSIVHQWKSFQCPCCGSLSFPPDFQIRKIYFYWVTKEQETLAWFAETMKELAELDTENRLEIHNYFSPLARESVVAPLRALQTFIHDVDGHDIVSGLTTKQVTHFGRPEWKTELERIATEQQQRLVEEKRRDGEERARKVQSFGGGSNEADDVAVFFCGPKNMGQEIHDECIRFNQKKAHDVSRIMFDFYSELY